MAERLWRWFFGSCLTGVLILMLMPLGNGQMLPGQDKLLHGVIFLFLFLLGTRAFPSTPDHKKLFVGLLAYGVIVELLQGLTDYRSMDVLDVLADVAGLFVGWLWSLRKPGPGGCCG
ncbi:MAG: VanZ family protein [Gammaproteobacteria bacterium]|nr:MAG: VanZ family protein [Gammaproteobacteria bacterium]